MIYSERNKNSSYNEKWNRYVSWYEAALDSEAPVLKLQEEYVSLWFMGYPPVWVI